MGQTKYLCPFCRTVLKGKKRIEKHFIAKHPDNIDDIEVCVPTYGEEGKGSGVVNKFLFYPLVGAGSGRLM